MNPTDIINLIRARAQAYGIDPDQAVNVARSEGLNNYVGDKGSSFGPFQLHYGGVAPGGNAVSGLGDDFTKQTGLDARDPNTVPQQVDFALNYASQHGWGPWHGWTGNPYAGISSPPMTPGSPAPAQPPPINVASLPVPQAQAPILPGVPQQQQKQQPQQLSGAAPQQQADPLLQAFLAHAMQPTQLAQAGPAGLNVNYLRGLQAFQNAPRLQTFLG